MRDVKNNKSLIEKALLGNSASSVLGVAAANRNMHFFVMIFEKFFANFSSNAKSQICDAVRGIDAPATDFKPLLDYLERYNKQSW